MGTWVISFVGFAALYGTALSLVLLGALALAGRFPGWRVLPLLVLTLSFVFLTMHPFPDPDTLICPVPTATPQLMPGGFFQIAPILRGVDASLREWLTNLTIVATAMNFVVCLFIGLAFARLTPGLGKAALFGAGLTLFVELTQLTGLWGIYPCAYRQFNVDDLIMNLLGVLVGAALFRRVRNRSERAP